MFPAGERATGPVAFALECRHAADPEDPFRSAAVVGAAIPILLNIGLEIALRGLPSAQRRTIVLHDVAGYTNREIAALDAIPYHTVRTRLFRARRAMRDALTTKAA